MDVSLLLTTPLCATVLSCPNINDLKLFVACKQIILKRVMPAEFVRTFFQFHLFYVFVKFEKYTETSKAIMYFV